MMDDLFEMSDNDFAEVSQNEFAYRRRGCKYGRTKRGTCRKSRR